MTVALLGGAFDPPHLGHVELAREAVSRFGLDRLVVVVTGRAPHKLVETGAETRLKLSEAAFGDLPGVEVSRDGERFVHATQDATAFLRRLLDEHGDAVVDLEVRRASLEDAYLDLVQRHEAGQSDEAVRAFKEVV